MTRRGLLMSAVLLSLSFTPASESAAAESNDIHVVCSVNMRPLLTALTASYEASPSGHKLAVTFDSAGGVRKRILAGEAFDAVLVQRATIDDLAANNKIATNSVRDIAHSTMIVFAKAGTPAADISTLDSFKRLLSEAKSLTYPDPAVGGLSGLFIAAMIKNIGMEDALKAKSRLAANTEEAVHLVSAGEAEYGISQRSEIRSGELAVIGPLPAELHGSIALSAAVVATAQDPDTGQSLVNFLASPAAAEAVKANRLDP